MRKVRREKRAKKSGPRKVGQREKWGKEKSEVRKVWHKVGRKKWGKEKSEVRKVGREKWDEKSGARKVGREKRGRKSGARKWCAKSGTKKVG